MTTISMAPQWAGLNAAASLTRTEPGRAEAEQQAAAAQAPPSPPPVAVRQLRPGAFKAYVPTSLIEAAQQEAAPSGGEAVRQRQTIWIRSEQSAVPGSGLDLKA